MKNKYGERISATRTDLQTVQERMLEQFKEQPLIPISASRLHPAFRLYFPSIDRPLTPLPSLLHHSGDVQLIIPSPASPPPSPPPTPPFLHVTSLSRPLPSFSGFAAVVGVLARGIWAFQKGDRLTSFRMMRYRVLFQGGAVLLLCFGVFFAGRDRSDPGVRRGTPTVDKAAFLREAVEFTYNDREQVVREQQERRIGEEAGWATER